MHLAQQSADNLMPNTNNTEDRSRQYTMINNVYEQPSTRQIKRYYHARAGFPIKATWLETIQARFYATWPMLTTTAVMKYFPELDKTQKRTHMAKQAESTIN